MRGLAHHLSLRHSFSRITTQTNALTLFSLQSYPQTCYKLLMEGYDGVFGHLIKPTVTSFSWNDDWEINYGHETVRLLKTTLEERRDAIDRLLSAQREK